MAFPLATSGLKTWTPVGFMGCFGSGLQHILFNWNYLGFVVSLKALLGGS